MAAYELEALTAPELRRLIDRTTRTVVVPFGSIEHQGGHLPLGADALLADVVGRAVAERVDAALVPTIRVGNAEQHMHGAGTLTLRSPILTEVAVDIGESLRRQGFRLIVLVSAHSGNRLALRAAAERLNQVRAAERLNQVRAAERLNQVRGTGRLNQISGGALVCTPEGDVGPNPGAHSGAWLTSVMLALRPELVDLDSADASLAEELQAASVAAGAIHLERFVGSIVDGVRAAAVELEASGSD